jgi:phage gpG-like protein
MNSVREFSSLGALAKHAFAVAAREPFAQASGRGVVGESMVGLAQSMIGHSMNFAPLAESTVRERLRLGYQPYTTLLRSGEYRRSFSWSHYNARITDVGSTSPFAPYHELGTPTNKPPKRSVLIEPSIRRDAIYFELFAKTYFLVIDA